MMKTIFWVIVVLFCFACNFDERGVLPEKKMKAILSDFFLVEIYDDSVKDFYLKRDSLQRVQYATILKKHEVSDSVFVKTYRFYMENPLKMKALLEDIKKQIEALK